jgi:hypothetical protein
MLEILHNSYQFKGQILMTELLLALAKYTISLISVIGTMYSV